MRIEEEGRGGKEIGKRPLKNHYFPSFLRIPDQVRDRSWIESGAGPESTPPSFRGKPESRFPVITWRAVDWIPDRVRNDGRKAWIPDRVRNDGRKAWIPDRVRNDGRKAWIPYRVRNDKVEMIISYIHVTL